MQAMYVDVLLIVALILAGGVLATSELAIGTASRARLKQLSSRGDGGAAVALGLSEHPNHLLWTAQGWSTLFLTLAGVSGGAMLVPRMSVALDRAGLPAPYDHLIGLCMVALAITVGWLVFGQIVPRRVALTRPVPIARLLSRPVKFLSLAAVPAVGILSVAADRVLGALGVRPPSEPPVTEEEISVLLQEGAKAGVLEEGEHEMIKRVLRFSDRRARALMTPRNEVVWIDLADSPDEVRRKVITSPHSRFPVCDQGLDNLIGIVQVRDLLNQDQNTEPFRIKGRLTLPLFIYEGTRGLKILEMFKKSATRVAVVLDEYGTVEGLLSLTDILEAIVGDMPDGDQEDEPAAVQRDDGSWLLDGRLPLDEFRDLFELPAVPEGDFHTLAGLVVTQLGHIPRIAEKFDGWGLEFEVVDMDGNRVDRILVKRGAHGRDGS
jgi:putative hemolysin